jgi:hypothetical protein
VTGVVASVAAYCMVGVRCSAKLTELFVLCFCYSNSLGILCRSKSPVPNSSGRRNMTSLKSGKARSSAWETLDYCYVYSSCSAASQSRCFYPSCLYPTLGGGCIPHEITKHWHELDTKLLSVRVPCNNVELKCARVLVR